MKLIYKHGLTESTNLTLIFRTLDKFNIHSTNMSTFGESNYCLTINKDISIVFKRNIRVNRLHTQLKYILKG